MTRATPFLVALLLTLPSGGSSQAAPSPGDRVRVRQLDGAVLTGTLATFSSEGIRLSIDSVSPPVEVPVSAIEALEASLSRESRFTKYYGMSLAASTLLGGIVGRTRGNECIDCGDVAGGLLLGYLMGIPLGAVIGSLVTEERGSPVAIPGSAQSGPTIRPVIGREVGFSAGQRIRVRAADALRMEGVFVAFEGQDLLVSTSQVGPDQRVPVDRLQALWVQERATRKGAVIGGMTGAVLGVGVGAYGREYVLDPGEFDGGDLVAITVVGAGWGAVPGALIGYLVRGWSPVWP